MPETKTRYDYYEKYILESGLQCIAFINRLDLTLLFFLGDIA